jgi:hypothetical protein
VTPSEWTSSVGVVVLVAGRGLNNAAGSASKSEVVREDPDSGGWALEEEPPETRQRDAYCSDAETLEECPLEGHELSGP